jgi:hypothetical protein
MLSCSSGLSLFSCSVNTCFHGQRPYTINYGWKSTRFHGVLELTTKSLWIPGSHLPIPGGFVFIPQETLDLPAELQPNLVNLNLEDISGISHSIP